MCIPVKVWSSEDFANIWYEHLTFWSVRQNSVKDFCRVDSEQFITTFHISLKNESVNSFFFLTIPWLITAKGKVRFHIQEKNDNDDSFGQVVNFLALFPFHID